MLYAVKHIGLDSGIMIHIKKRETLSRFKRRVKLPITHIIAAKTGIATQPIDKKHLHPHHHQLQLLQDDKASQGNPAYGMQMKHLL